MADDDSEDEEPAIVLGDGVEVEGAPLARVSARFMWGIEKSEIEGREGETTIRTPDGPHELGEVLADVDQTYFGTRQEFEQAVRAVIGSGPVPTPEVDEPDDESEADEAADTEAETEEQETDAEPDDSEEKTDADGDVEEAADADSEDAEEGSEAADADSEDADGDAEESVDEEDDEA